jgi:trimethylamine--corrinoid protein Co-methyltransferase
LLGAFVGKNPGQSELSLFNEAELLAMQAALEDEIDKPEENQTHTNSTILGVVDRLHNNVVIMANVNTNSPLLIDRVVSEAIQVYSSRGQAMVVTPFILTGAMGPVSTAASVAQAMAEAMICCAYVQLVKPGAPFVMGNFLSSMSLKSGAPTFGMPEPVLSNYVIGQLARRAGLPLRCGGS